MTIFDYLVLLVLGLSLVVGVLRGFVREAGALVAWVVAYVVANAFSPQLAGMLTSVPGATVRLVVAFLVLLIGTRLLMGLVNMAAEALITAGGLSPVDRFLGALFGLLRAVVIILAIVTVCAMTSIPRQPFWKNAKLRPYVEGTARAVKPLLPEALARHVRY